MTVTATAARPRLQGAAQYPERGRPLAEAVTEGARKGLRPIVMTAAATVPALTPMAFGVTVEPDPA